jgi:hypothetical protein
MPLAYEPQRTTMKLLNATARTPDSADGPQEESHWRRCGGVPARSGILARTSKSECGFEWTYISRVERGNLNPTAIRIWAIADALKLPFHEMARNMESWVAMHATLNDGIES